MSLANPAADFRRLQALLLLIGSWKSLPLLLCTGSFPGCSCAQLGWSSWSWRWGSAPRVKAQVHRRSDRKPSEVQIKTAWLLVLPYKRCAYTHALLDNKIGLLQVNNEMTVIPVNCLIPSVCTPSAFWKMMTVELVLSVSLGLKFPPACDAEEWRGWGLRTGRSICGRGPESVCSEETSQKSGQRSVMPLWGCTGNSV